MENKKYKIYVVLSQTHSGLAKTIKHITHEKYSHVSIAFDDKCHEMYSFGRKYRYFPFWGIFKREYLNEGLFLNKNANMAICEINVTKTQYDNIKKRIMEIKDTNQGYNIVGLLLAYFRIKLHRNKYYCSEFVYEVLSSDGIEILDKNEILFQPEEIISNINYNLIYEGEIKNF